MRIVRLPDGTLAEGRTLPGRGAYLCADTVEACRAAAEKRKAFARALRTP